MKKILLLSFLLINHFSRADFWTQKAAFPGVGTTAPFSFAIGNLGYLGCGGLTNEFWEYDPASNIWTQKANFGGVVREYALGFSIGNKGYAGTGRDGFNALADFWEYDPATNLWTQKANFPFLREGGIVFSYGTKGYMGTGHDSPSNTTTFADLWEYDPVTDTWTQKANFPPGPRVWSNGLAIDNKGYLACGTDGIGIFYHDFWEYDPMTNLWTQKASFPGTDLFDAAAFSICKMGFIGTGETGAGFTSDFWQYDPSQDLWTQKTSFPGATREETGFFSIGEKGYVGLGVAGTSYFDFWEYTPDNICTVVAAFTAANHICPGTCTNFTNLSANGTTFQWNFPGASPSSSTDANPTNICYNSPGNYGVTLIAANANGSDTLTLNNYITVYPYPAPQGITQSGDTLFANQGAVSYQWYHGGVLIPGATNYYYVASEGGDYNIVATDANNCEVEAAIFDVIASINPMDPRQPWAIVQHPGGDKLTLVYHQQAKEINLSIAIFDATGKKVLDYNADQLQPENSIDIDVSGFDQGIYILQIHSGTNSSVVKFLKN